MASADRLSIKGDVQNRRQNVLQREVYPVLGRFSADDVVEGGLAGFDQRDGANVLRWQLRPDGQINVQLGDRADLDVADLNVAKDLVSTGVHLVGEDVRTWGLQVLGGGSF